MKLGSGHMSAARAVAVAAGLLAGGATQQAAAQDWPTEPITVVVGFNAGGSTDRFVRLMAPYVAEELGAAMPVVNKGGASSQLGATYFLQRGAECNTIFGSSLSPFLQLSILKGNASYTMEDFAFINGQWGDLDLLFTGQESRFQTLDDLIAEIRDKPRSVSAALITGGSSELNLRLLLENFDIPYENVNVVSYESGGKVRTAVAGGTVDFTVVSADGSTGVKDIITPIALFTDEPLDGWDVPYANTLISEMGQPELPQVDGSLRGFAASAECKAQHPERFQMIVDAMRAALERDDVKAALDEAAMGANWIGPDATDTKMNSAFDLYERYKDVMGG